MKKIIYNRELVNFYELPEEWQEEAKVNDEDNFEETIYVLPEEDKNPTDHYLLDLNECMRSDGGDYDGIIGISNNSAIGVDISPCGTMCRLTYL